MNSHYFYIALIYLLFSSPVSTLMGAEDPPISDSPKIVVTISPIQSFSERIVGDVALIRSLVSAQATPHVFDPKPSDIRALAHAHVLIMVGLDLEEPWATKMITGAANPTLEVIRLGYGIKTIGVPHPNPHVWVSPHNAIRMVQNLQRHFIRIYPEHQTTFKANGHKLDRQLHQLDEEFKTKLGLVSDKRFIATRPAFVYLARDYELTDVATIAGPHGHPPSPKKLAKIIKMIQDENISVLLKPRQVKDGVAQSVVEETGVRLVEWDLFGRPGEDYNALMKRNLKALIEGFRNGEGRNR